MSIGVFAKQPANSISDASVRSSMSNNSVPKLSSVLSLLLLGLLLLGLLL